MRLASRIVELIPTDGQSEFDLPSGSIIVHTVEINDVFYYAPLDFVVTGKVLSWQNREFSLDSDDVLRVTYTEVCDG